MRARRSRAEQILCHRLAGFPSPVAAAAAAEEEEAEMSYMRGDLLTKTRKLVKGLAKPAPTWLKAMEQSVLPRYPSPPASLLSPFPDFSTRAFVFLLRPFDVGAVNPLEMWNPRLAM
jgi:hypothetical protein